MGLSKKFTPGSRYLQGWFAPKHPEKYLGDLGDIFFRSSWERKFMIILDLHPRVLRWGSEMVKIRYLDAFEEKVRNYYVDFYFEMLQANGELVKFLVEVKPDEQTRPPKPPRGKETEKKKMKYLNSHKIYMTNQQKFAAAKEFCKIRGWVFMVVTEKNMNF